MFVKAALKECLCFKILIAGPGVRTKEKANHDNEF